MKQFLTALDKGMTPVLSLTYLAGGGGAVESWGVNRFR